ncbi:PhzF family phenazine biosynthesis protein [Desulfoluna spongiiphila]|uniref:Phenazine biosynthesis protein PhzF family n=1 Tax=Desulfoluna spongiiphila TaxID=419481 RepID=A0A1G5AV28_9BACT|nr:PhzF family phenazine biosynthesis protein [Desulfoluna spongiiphila]SCX81739.1 phenazine biosynthesis protein PhzF family [Desulfoluna spongiiphila]
MMRLFLQQAYTEAGHGGNGAGVVVFAEGMDEATMQAVARDVGLSETAFVTGLSEGAPTIRYFTPVAEVDLCGHATVAAWTVMAHLGLVQPGRHRQGLREGDIGVTLDDSGMVWMEQKAPAFGPILDPVRVAPILGLSVRDLTATGLPVQPVSTGLMDIMVPLPSRDLLEAVTPDFDAMAAFNNATDTVGFHLFCLEPRDPSHTACCRNFAPRYGIDEESATGSASGALAACLWVNGHRRQRYVFEQGHAMGSPSRMDVILIGGNGVPTGVTVGGYGGTPVEKNRLLPPSS